MKEGGQNQILFSCWSWKFSRIRFSKTIRSQIFFFFFFLSVIPVIDLYLLFAFTFRWIRIELTHFDKLSLSLSLWILEVFFWIKIWSLLALFLSFPPYLYDHFWIVLFCLLFFISSSSLDLIHHQHLNGMRT